MRNAILAGMDSLVGEFRPNLRHAVALALGHPVGQPLDFIGRDKSRVNVLGQNDVGLLSGRRGAITPVVVTAGEWPEASHTPSTLHNWRMGWRLW